MDDRARALAVPRAWLAFASTAIGDDLVRWAEGALETGLDSPSLRRLAALGLPAALSEASPLLRRALEELGIRPPITDEEARRHHLADVCDEMLSGARTVEQALDEIERTVVSPLGHPDDLMPWCYLGSGLSEGPDGIFASLGAEEREAAALAAARRLRRRAP